jgi:protein ImuB
MDRLACVDVPALPLQLLLRQHPDWRDKAVAVVAEDRPQAPLLYVNEEARRAKVLPGQRFATALGLSKDLRAGIVSAADVARAVVALAQGLRRRSPHVEPALQAPGVFWLDASGLGRLYPELAAWAQAVAEDMGADGFVATVVVGFTRFGVYALAKGGRGTKVFTTPEDERDAVRRVPLARLDLDPDVRERLAALAVHTIGDFLSLPAGGIRRRFGADAHRLHRLASGDLWAPLVPVPPEPQREKETDLEAPETEALRLLFVIKHELDALLSELAGRREALTELRLELTLDDGRECCEMLRPAAPTLDGVQILGLVRLRLETLRLTSGVASLRLRATATPTTAEQVQLFRESRRDPDAADRALARLRAEFGDDVVVRVRLQDGHLPQARFRWEPVAAASRERPQPQRVDSRPLVRRIYEKPLPLPPRERHEPDGWLLRGFECGRVEKLSGPYDVSGGWWSRAVEREYYFAHMSRGDVLWIYYDRRRRRFFVEGRVE